MEEVRRRTSQFGLDIVMVNVWEHRGAADEARHFCEVHGIAGPVLLDEDGGYIERLGLHGVPINLLVDEQGVVQAVGATTPTELEQTLMRAFMPGA